MRRIGIILGILALSLLPVIASSNTVWLTYRDTVDVTSGTADISATFWHNQTTTQTYRNVTLPCQVGQLDSTATKFAIKANGGDITYDLSVNGHVIKSGQTVTSGNWDNTTLADMGVSSSDTYLNFTFSVSADTNIIKIVVCGNDVELTSDWISDNIVVKEKDITEPEVGTSSTSSFWTVNDSITVFNNLGYALSDVNLALTYPSHKITAPSSNVIISSIPDGSSGVAYVQYQKYAPYVYKVKDESSGNTHKVIVYIKTRELLTNCVDWTIDPKDDVYNGAFDDLDTSTLTVKYNNVEKEFTVNDDGTITIEDFTVRGQYSSNKFVFTWTTPSAGEAVTTEVPWYEQTYFGIQIWMLIAVAVLLALVVIAATKQ